MKKFAFAFLFIAFFSDSSFADSHDRSMAVTTNVGTAFGGYFALNYYYKLNDKITMVIPVEWYDYRLALARVYSRGYAPFVGYVSKFHYTGKSLRGGAYLAPMARVGYVVHPTDTVNPNGNFILRTGAMFGYDHVFNCGFMVDASVGMELYYLFGKMGEEKIVGPRWRHDFFRPYAQLSLGYAF